MSIQTYRIGAEFSRSQSQGAQCREYTGQRSNCGCSISWLLNSSIAFHFRLSHNDVVTSRVLMMSFLYMYMTVTLPFCDYWNHEAAPDASVGQPVPETGAGDADTPDQ